MIGHLQLEKSRKASQKKHHTLISWFSPAFPWYFGACWLFLLPNNLCCFLFILHKPSSFLMNVLSSHDKAVRFPQSYYMDLHWMIVFHFSLFSYKMVIGNKIRKSFSLAFTWQNNPWIWRGGWPWSSVGANHLGTYPVYPLCGFCKHLSAQVLALLIVS